MSCIICLFIILSYETNVSVAGGVEQMIDRDFCELLIVCARTALYILLQH